MTIHYTVYANKQLMVRIKDMAVRSNSEAGRAIRAEIEDMGQPFHRHITNLPVRSAGIRINCIKE